MCFGLRGDASYPRAPTKCTSEDRFTCLFKLIVPLRLLLLLAPRLTGVCPCIAAVHASPPLVAGRALVPLGAVGRAAGWSNTHACQGEMVKARTFRE